jgi:hypothetical protein
MIPKEDLKTHSTGYQSAITWRTLSALLFAAAAVQPIVIYLSLVGSEALIGLSLITYGGGFGMGYSMYVFTSVGGQILWLVVLLWSWLAQIAGSPLSRKEVFMIYTFYPLIVGAALLFINPIFNLYVANSEIIEGLGLADFIPWWWAPRGLLGQASFASRSLFSQGMLTPTMLSLLLFFLQALCGIALGVFSYQRFAVVEKLDFPAATTSASGLLAIADRNPDTLRPMVVGIGLGLIFGFFSFALPTIMMAPSLSFIPRGLIDFTYLVETSYPGAAFGIDVTWTNIAVGFVIPFKILLIQALASILARTIGNFLLVQYGIWPDWAPNYGLGWNFARSSLYFWTSVTIGLSLAAVFVPIILHPKRFANVFRLLMRSSSRNVREEVSPKILLLAFVGSTSIAVILFNQLVPDFPAYILPIFVMGWSFFGTVVAANASGVTFQGFWVPYLKESLIYYSGYKNPSGWFAKDYLMLSQEGASHCANLKMANLCGVSTKEYIVGFAISIIISILFGLLYASLFWTTAPIPSSVYRFTVEGWPIMALEMSRWTKWLWTGIIFKTDIILASLGIGSAIAFISDFIGSPWLLIASVTGINTMPSIALSQLVGGLLSKILESQIGETWKKAKSLITVGMFIGSGIMLGFGSTFGIIRGSMWVLPY